MFPAILSIRIEGELDRCLLFEISFEKPMESLSVAEYHRWGSKELHTQLGACFSIFAEPTYRL